MTVIVVDASIVTKWYFPEEYTTEALSLLDESYTLRAPDLLSAEFGNAAWQKVRRDESTLADAQAAVNSFASAPVELYASFSLLPSAFSIANDTGRTMYDSLYLALALALGCPLVTADLRFYNALQVTSHAKSLVWIENL
jgi:predicted nucleic acid-binding protein